MGAAALLLADGRFPAGGHAHSGGLEVGAHRGRVADLADLESFLRGRLATAGIVDAALAAATCHRAQRHEALVPWAALVVEAEARQPSPAMRAAWATQGRQLLRAGLRTWPGPILSGLLTAVPEGPPHPIALGACAAAAGLAPAQAAGNAAYQSITGPATAAVRLMGLDPFSVAGLLAAMVPAVDLLAEEMAEVAEGSLGELPCLSAPLLEIGAEDHASWEVRLFAS